MAEQGARTQGVLQKGSPCLVILAGDRLDGDGLVRAVQLGNRRQMRIVHDIESEPQVSGGPVHVYVQPKGEKPPSKDFKVSLLITNTIFGEEEVIYIEGSAKNVRQALLDAVEVVEISGQHLVEEGRLSPHWKGESENEPSERS